MGLIQVPFGKPVIRITISVDAKGQLEMKGARDIAGRMVPLSVLESCQIVGTALAGGLTAMVQDGMKGKQNGEAFDKRNAGGAEGNDDRILGGAGGAGGASSV